MRLAPSRWAIDDSREVAGMSAERSLLTEHQRADTDVVFDPSTYAEGVPFDVLARLDGSGLRKWSESRVRVGRKGRYAGWFDSVGEEQKRAGETTDGAEAGCEPRLANSSRGPLARPTVRRLVSQI